MNAAQKKPDVTWDLRHVPNDRRRAENDRRFRDRALAEFGAAALALLNSSPKWNGETLAAIASAAIRCGVVDNSQVPVFKAALAARRKSK